MPCTDAQKQIYRERYAQRCEDPAYREKVRMRVLAAYYRRKEQKQAAALAIAEAEGLIPTVKRRGRPRKYALDA